MALGLIRSGDICVVNFAPARASEADHIRPAVIVTNNAANAQNAVITVVPQITNVERVYHFQLLLPDGRTGLEHDSKAQVEQIRNVALSRVIKRLGQVPADLMQELDGKIRLHLAL